MKQRLLITTLLLAFAVPASAQIFQTISVTGTVTDVDGLPLPNVTIAVAIPFQGTATDLDGTYSLDIQTRTTPVTVTFSSV